MRAPTVRFAVRAWTVGFGAALVTQGLFRRRFGRATGWGHNPGWQREIAVWNLGTLVTAAGLAQAGPGAERAQARGFAVLSALFCLNHAAAAVRDPRGTSNWAGAAANAAGLGIGMAALNSQRPGDASPRRGRAR